MRIRSFPRDLLMDVLANSNVDLGEGAIRTDYDHDRVAFGVVLHDLRDLARFMFELGSWAGLAASDAGDTNEHELLTQLADAIQVDSMGRDLIVYFPGFKLTSTD